MTAPRVFVVQHSDGQYLGRGHVWVADIHEAEILHAMHRAKSRIHLFGGTAIGLVFEADYLAAAARVDEAQAETERLRVQLAEAKWLVHDAMDSRYDGHEVWNERAHAWLGALAETEGAK